MRYFVIAGEASGDLHASNLIRALRLRDPQAEFYAYGGELMQQAGASMLCYYRDIAYMGVVNVALHARTILRAMARCKRQIAGTAPDVVVLVDYPGFNLSIARYVKKHTPLPVYYYIPPKVWAWKESRIKLLRAYVDGIFSILPFETQYFGQRGITVHYAGNPTASEIKAFKEGYSETFREFALNNGLDPERRIIALLAGSRKQEIAYNLKRMCMAAQTFAGEGYQLVIAGAPNIDDALYRSRIPAEMLARGDVKIVANRTFALLCHARSALVTSGTATLEAALFGVPQVVCYYIPMGKLVSALRRRLLKVPYVSLVNLIAGEEVVRELVADGMRVEACRAELQRITPDGESRDAMLAGYARVSAMLGDGDASQRAAVMIAEAALRAKGGRK